MGVLMHTQNPCYKANKRRKPTMIIIHGTGANNPNINRYAGPDDGIIGKNKYDNHWNRASANKLGNAIIGKLADGTVAIYQTMDWDVRPWLSGSHTKGNGNDYAIQWECCQDFGASSPKGTAKTWYWNEVRTLNVHLCAWLCQEYGIDVKNVIDHREARARGIASNHGDIRNWQVLFGDTMDKLRADVQAMLNGTVAPPPTAPVPTPPPPATEEPLAAAVQTGSSSLNFRAGPGTAHKLLGTIKRGASLDVFEIKGSWARVTSNRVMGWCSANFLTIDFLDTDPEEPAAEDKVMGRAVQDKSAGLNLREGPGTSYRSLGMIPRYTDLEVYEVKGTWVRVQWGNKMGWVSKNYLTIDYTTN